MGIHVIKMPDLGEGIAEVEVVEWHVKPGDTIKEDQVLADVMTDKATVEIPSPVHGTVVSLGGAIGESLAVGAELIRLEVEGAGNHSADKDKPKAQAPAPVSEQDAVAEQQAGEPVAVGASGKPSGKPDARPADVSAAPAHAAAARPASRWANRMPSQPTCRQRPRPRRPVPPRVPPGRWWRCARPARSRWPRQPCASVHGTWVSSCSM
jgi:2-oxoisovalerate dehydrogenase E2 component (dihydrolipoyl transacylase)